jgi:phosphoribosylformimino-5-aminoimidazole carboxamide ribotide isomerase
MDGRKTPPEPFDLLAAIDLRGGRVVRLVRGDFAQETIYGDDPAEIAAGFVDAGARWLHVVDLDGARNPAQRQLDVVAAIVTRVGERSRVEVAGGLRDAVAVDGVLRAGAARAVVGTAALADPTFVRRLVDEHGAERVCVALDGWVPGAAGIAVADALAVLAEAGARTFEVTAIDRDGTLGGPDLPLLARLVAAGRGAIVASAGISTLDDLRAVRSLGCSGAIVGRALYEGRLDLSEALVDAPTSNG